MTTGWERVTTVAMVGAFASCVGMFSLSVYDRVMRTTTTEASLRIGDRLGDLAGITFASRDHTLLVALRSSCHFCSESLPLYRQVVATRDAGRWPLRIAAVCMEPLSECMEYLRRNSLTVDQIVEADRHSLRVTGTPTVLLVNKSGRIDRIWVGHLSPSKETELLTTLFNTPADGTDPPVGRRGRTSVGDEGPR